MAKKQPKKKAKGLKQFISESAALLEFQPTDTGELNFPDSPINFQKHRANILEQLKTYLRKLDKRLEKEFKKKVNIRILVQTRAICIDKLVVALWKYLTQSNNDILSLIAVGGYGRGELHPFSDIDLLILSGSELSNEQKSTIEFLISLLWDCQLKVGQSVRTLEECIDLAAQDVSVTTNLMESRLLIGNVSLFEQLKHEVSPERMWPQDHFFIAKKNEQKVRYKRFDGTSFDLEPNIKSSPGGLRDIQLIGWMAQRIYYPKTLEQLVKQAVITKKEYYTLVKSQLFLWRIRFALHLASGKSEDRLLFDFQKTTAEIMGYKDDDNSLAVEKMMKHYFRAVLVIRNMSDILLQILEQKAVPTEQREKAIEIDAYFEIINQRIEAKNTKCFTEKPRLLLTVFHHVARDPSLLGIGAKTLRAIRAARNMITPHFRKSPDNQQLFVDFWRILHTSSRAMFLMKRSGILADYLEIFRQITGQMQYDMFHNYTVDEHSLFLLKNLTEFADPEHNHEFPLCSEIMQRQTNPEIIFLAGLFHDIGKGRGGDHSEIGAKEVRLFCQTHPIDSAHADIIEWLVANHLLMSLVAQKRDITNPKVVQNFADLVKTQLRLDLLYVLTVADIRATSNKLWNSWKDSLLKELYLSTSRMLCEDSNDTEERWLENKKAAQKRLIDNGLSEASIGQLWQHLDRQFFAKRSVESIVWQTQSVLESMSPGGTNTENETVVNIKTHDELSGTEVFVYSRDRENLFANLTASLNQQGLSIQAANIYTDKNSYCYDSFFVLDSRGEKIDDQNIIHRIKSNILNNLEKINEPIPTVQQRMPRQFKYFNIPIEVQFFDDEYSGMTRMELTAMDRPGLLAAIGSIFKTTKTRLHDARITTLGEKVEDIFIISHSDNSPIKSIRDKNKIRQEIIKQLELPY